MYLIKYVKIHTVFTPNRYIRFIIFYMFFFCIIIYWWTWLLPPLLCCFLSAHNSKGAARYDWTHCTKWEYVMARSLFVSSRCWGKNHLKLSICSEDFQGHLWNIQRAIWYSRPVCFPFLCLPASVGKEIPWTSLIFIY